MQPGDSEAERKGAAASSRPSASAPVRPGAGPVPPLGTNAWAKETIKLRARAVGLPPTTAERVSVAALWYYQRILLRINRRGSGDQELPPSTNRYLVPVTLALACRYQGVSVELDRFLKLSGTPTKRTTETAHALLAEYARSLTPARGPSASRGATPRSTPAPGAGAARRRSPSSGRGPPVSAASPSVASSTALAVPSARTIPGPEGRGGRAGAASPRTPARPRQLNTNNWVRTRIPELCRTLGLPEPIRRRALRTYEQIVDLHTARGNAAPGKRLQLSPRLNWSLAYVTVYIACRAEEYPKDLPEILGRHPRQGMLREMYRLYRFYKRELRLDIKLVDVRTFIHSWFDGFEVGELIRENLAAAESVRLRERAVTIANQARADEGLRNASSKIVAAGALSTALAEKSRPGDERSFYAFMARLLQISEDAMRAVVARIAVILAPPRSVRVSGD